MLYQVTIFSTIKENKPISCVVRRSATLDLTDGKAKQSIITDGLVKILSKKGWNKNSLKKYSYSKIKVREYNKEEIEKQNTNRYNLIKAMMYRSGEWQRPTQEKE